MPAMTLPSLSRRLGGIAPFHVMEYVKQARALEAAGRDIIHMSIGEPDFKALPAVEAALGRAVQAGHTGYTPALGIAELRQAIADFQSTVFGYPVDASRVMVTAGASVALTLICLALLDPGDEVLLPDPSYPCNSNFVRAAGGVPRLIVAGPEQRFQLSADLIRANWTPRCKAVMLASPSNPTGTSLTPDALREVAETVRELGGTLILDEIYLGLRYDGVRLSGAALGDNVVLVNSFSKYFAMTGWRLGWLVLPPAWVSELERLAGNLLICPSGPAQHAALACFTAEAIAEYEQRREAFRQRRDFLVPALESLGFKVPVHPDGAFYVYADGSAHGTAEAVAQRMLQEAGVCAVPGLDFGPAWADRYLRFSYATSLSRLQEAVQRLQAVL
jgi:aspartate/methionine/tyrosine aminotransferase